MESESSEEEDEMQSMMKWQMMMNKAGKQKKESSVKVAQLIESQSEMMGEIARQIGEKKRKEQEEEHLNFLRKRLQDLESKYEEKRRKDEFSFQKSMNDAITEQMMSMGNMGAPSSADTLMLMMNQNLQNQLPGSLGVQVSNPNSNLLVDSGLNGGPQVPGGPATHPNSDMIQPNHIPNPLQLPGGFPQSLLSQARSRPSQIQAISRRPGPFDLILSQPALMAQMKPKDMLLLDYLSKKHAASQVQQAPPVQIPKMFTYPKAPGEKELRTSKGLAQNGKRVMESKAEKLLRELYN